MKKTIDKKKLSLDTTTISRLTSEQLQGVEGGLRLTRPYTKVSLCANGNPCASEVC